MPKDYKNINNKKKNQPPGWHAILPFTTGLVIGLFVAFIVYLNEHQIFIENSDTPEIVIENTDNSAESGQYEEKIADVPEPQFDFYQILPNMEVNVSEWEADEEKTGVPEDNGSVYILQVGSFQEYEAADEVKAQLALLGISADIQRVVINGRDIRHRVRVGPYKDTEKLHEARNRLTENNLDFMLLKLKVDDI